MIRGSRVVLTAHRIAAHTCASRPVARWRKSAISLAYLIDVEVGIVRQATRHSVDRCLDRERHHPRVKVGTEFTLRLVAGGVLLEDLHGFVDTRRAVEAFLPSAVQMVQPDS